MTIPDYVPAFFEFNRTYEGFYLVPNGNSFSLATGRWSAEIAISSKLDRYTKANAFTLEHFKSFKNSYLENRELK